MDTQKAPTMNVGLDSYRAQVDHFAEPKVPIGTRFGS
jgi:hypothetical protein